MRPLLVSAGDLEYDPAAVAKALPADGEGRKHVAALAELFAAVDVFDGATLEKILHDYVERDGLKFKQVGPPLRVALLGYMGGPHLPEVMDVLGREATLERLRRAAAV